MSTILTIDVFNGNYKPIPHGGLAGWDPDKQATWPASTATLIRGQRLGVLVDALLTRSEGEQLAQWVTRAPEMVLSHIYVTHGHADHFFGAGPLLRLFPDAELVTLPEALDEARKQTEPATMAAWSSWFHGQLDDHPAVPTALESDHIDLDGHQLQLLSVGGADGVTATVVHIPEQDVVVSGDIAYNGIHMWLVGSTPQSRADWIASIDRIETLQPKTVITGHRDPGVADDDAHRILDQSRSYISDFDQAVRSADAAADLVAAMLSSYGNFGNPYTLYAAAASQFPSSPSDEG